MAFSSTLIALDYVGSYKRQVYYFNAASVTSGSINTGINIKWTELQNKTGQRGAVDDTSTAKTVALSGLTSNDVGYVIVYGT